jgi:trans-aconitate methyltransferase
MATTATAQAVQPGEIDLSALKTRQHGAWSSGDYAIVGTTLQIVGEELCEALDIRAGQKVLDVAAGNGNATLAAAHRWCDVVSTDYVPSLLERAHVPQPKVSRSSSRKRMRKRSTSATPPSTSCSRPSA